MSDSLKDYKNFVVAHLRELEIARAANDPQKMKYLADISDDELLKKWLWLFAIVGGIVCFLIMPFMFSIIYFAIPPYIMYFVRAIMNLAMGLVLISFCAAIYLTVKKD
jgi:hypothetical protein